MTLVPKTKVCFCDLSGECHVVTEITCCEVCTDFEKLPEFTPESVNKVFRGYEDRINNLATGLDNRERAGG